jgi:D-sedoheptulose 7-phosphate isomerase
MSTHINTYKEQFLSHFESPELKAGIDEAVNLLRTKARRIFFIGNGGSNSICSHMMEDYAKIARFPTFAFSDAALITCYANDYGYADAMKEWIKIHFQEGDALVAISSSGESANILNAVDFVNSQGGMVITLSGFKPGNKLSQKGQVNFHVNISDYGIVECFHQVILHIILDIIRDAK